MKSKVTIFSVFFLLMAIVFCVSGCSKFFAPSDEEIIKAVSESEYFKSGFGGITLQGPPKIVEKGERNKDGSWPVKIKVVFTVYVSKDQISAPMEQTRVFNIQKTKDSTGKTAWKAVLGQ